MRKTLLAFFLFCVIVNTGFCQLLATSPSFPIDGNGVPLIITVDATKGNKGLQGFSGNVFVHIGVITSASPGPSPWSNVQTVWGSTSAAAQSTPAGTNKWSFTINNIRTFFGLDASPAVRILKIAVLFRSGGCGSTGLPDCLAQRNADGTDMYIPVYQPNEFALKFTSPAMQPTFNPIPEPVITGALPFNVPVTAVSSKNANLTIRFNGNQIGTAAAAQTVSGTANVTANCDQQISAEANDNGTIKRDTINFFVAPATYPTAARPAGRKDGITYEDGNTKAVLILYAPLKNKVSVIGDFNNWTETCSSLLKKDGDYFWTEITGLTAGQQYRYQYKVDDTIRVADPYSELVLDPNNDQFISASTYANMPAYPTGKTTGGIVGVLTPGEAAYNWTSNSYVRPDKRDLMIYELLVRDFTAARNWQTLKDTLNYIKNLGFNAINLMPFNEFDGNESWGYNPMYFFAPDKYYGTKTALKAFIDQAHSLGIAVIQDIALNHATGQSAMAAMWWNPSLNQTAANNPYFYQTAQHPFNVFHDFNHNVAPTKLLTERFIQHWLTEYRIDGFRWDLSKGFTTSFSGDVGTWNQYNQGRINIWQNYYNVMQTASAGSYCILEHLSNDDEESELARRGMLLWGKMTDQYNENTMGYNNQSGNLDRSYWRYRTNTTIPGSNWAAADLADKPHLITYAESHDEERIMYKNLQFGNTGSSYNVKDLNTALQRTEAMAAILMATPGPKMIWQFGELGYDFSINRCENGTINNDCRTANKPVRWDYYQVTARRRLFETYAAMAKLRQQKPGAFRSSVLANGTNLGFDNNTSNPNNLIKTIVVDHPDLKYVVVANFNVTQQLPNVTFPATGTWYNYTQGGSINVTGTTYSLTLLPGEYRVFLNQNVSGGVVTSVRDIIATNADFRLSIYPNPIQQSATVKYELPKSGKVSVQLMNMQGQVLASKNMGFQLKGYQLFEMDRNSFAGIPLTAGQYVLQVRVDNLVRYEKVMVQQ